MKKAARGPAGKGAVKTTMGRGSPLSFVALGSLGEDALEGVGAGARARLKRQLARVKKEAQQAESAQAGVLCQAVDALLSGHEGQRARGVAVVADALAADCQKLPPEHPLWTLLGRGIILRAIAEFHAGEPGNSLASYGEAAAMLRALDGDRAFELWSYAMQQRVRLLGKAEGDEAGRLLDELTGAVEARFNPYARNRVLEASSVWIDLVDRGDVLPLAAIRERAGRALALPRIEPSVYTWEFVLHLLGRQAMALRFEQRHEEALASCSAVLPLLRRGTTPRAREHAAWALAEGAFIAADLLARPSEALPFIAALRAMIGRPRSGPLACELGYGVAMEARCLLLLGRLDEARAAIRAVHELEAAWPGEKGLWAAVAAVGVIQGDVLQAEGKLLESHDAWRAVINRFASNRDSALQTEVTKARQRMTTEPTRKPLP